MRRGGPIQQMVLGKVVTTERKLKKELHLTLYTEINVNDQDGILKLFI